MDSRAGIVALAAILLVLLLRLSVDARFSLDTLASFREPGAGARQALPAEVLDAAGAVNALGLREVMFAGRFAPHIDMRLHQRLVEYLYPVRVLPGGPHFVLLAGDAPPAGACRVLAEQGQAQVLHCE